MQTEQNGRYFYVRGEEPALRDFCHIVWFDCEGDAPDDAGSDLIEHVRTLREATEKTSSQAETRPGLAFLVTLDELPIELRRSLFAKGRAADVRVRFLQRSWLEAALQAPDQGAVLLDAVSRSAWRDPYDRKEALGIAEEFFGLVAQISRIAKDIGSAQPVVIYGMRAAGKTSLALQVMNRMTRAGHATVPRLLLDDRAPPASVARRVVREAARRVGLDPPPWSASDATAATSNDAIVETLRGYQRHWLTTRASGSLFFLLDECDGLLKAARDADDVSGLYDLFNLLRRLSEEHVASFVLVCMTPELAEANRLDGRRDGNANPLYGKCYTYRIPSLDASAAKELLRDLGARASLQWEADALDEAVRLCGGNPYLLRALGSAAWALLDDSVGGESLVSATTVKRASLREISTGRCGNHFRELTRELGDAGTTLVRALREGPVGWSTARDVVRAAHDDDAWSLALGRGTKLGLIAHDDDDRLSLFCELYRRWVERSAA